MESGAEHAEKPSVREIADLLAWARRLTQATSGAADAAELAAYQAAKRDLLARITQAAEGT